MPDYPGVPQIAISNLYPPDDITIPDGWCAVVVGVYEIPAGHVLDLLANSVIEIS